MRIFGSNQRRLLIIGTNDDALSAISKIKSEKTSARVVGFVSLSKLEHGLRIQGIPIRNSENELEQVLNHHGVDEVIWAEFPVDQDKYDSIRNLCIKNNNTIFSLHHVTLTFNNPILNNYGAYTNKGVWCR